MRSITMVYMMALACALIRMAQRWSTCGYRWEMPGGPPAGRCLATMQFIHDGERWWITSIIWDGENPNEPIPREYRPTMGSRGWTSRP